MQNQITGKLGESFAQEILVAQGYEILDTNVRRRRGEIDIVAYRDATYHFVEVKTRTSDRFGTPVEGIDYRKYRTIESLARQYLSGNRGIDEAWQIDCVGITLSRDNAFVSADVITNLEY